MAGVIIKEITTVQELKEVFTLCCNILGEINMDIYGYDAWHKRFLNGKQPLVFAMKDNKIVSAVLGRAENQDSLVIGMAACLEDYRRQGITKKLVMYFEELARKQGYKYITLGSKEDAFYGSCGYNIIFQTNGQNVYQKIL